MHSFKVVHSCHIIIKEIVIVYNYMFKYFTQLAICKTEQYVYTTYVYIG